MIIHQVYAKPTQTLMAHSLDVVALCLQSRMVMMQTVDDSVWQQVLIACLLHDLGKAADGFQRVMLHNDKDHIWRRERHRHEVLSLVWVARLLGHSDVFATVAAMVATHHKSWDYIQMMYGGLYADEEQARARRILTDQLEEDVDHAINQAIQQILADWITQHDWFRHNWMWQDMPADDALDFALSQITHHTRQPQHIQQAQLMRGLLMYLDHCASAGITHLQALILNPQQMLRHHQTLYSHQRAVQQQPNLMLIAPTGLGKTEAALLWAGYRQTEQPAPRLFYILPYQTSMNAMAQRLSDQLYDAAYTDSDQSYVSLLHSRIGQRHHQYAIQQGLSPKEANRYARQQRNRTQLMIAPMIVCSPYQLLKAIFGVRGHAIVWSTLHHARLIIDEIHSYEPSRTGMILALLNYLHRYYHTETLIMSATLPHPLQHAIHQIFSNITTIKPNMEDYQRVRRHRLHMLAHEIDSALHDIVADVQAGKRVLVTCNQVQRAQYVYQQLGEQLDDSRMLLLHGRFNGKDRQRIESELMARAGVGMPSTEGFVLVATQTVEVSLDVDFDCLYSEPAPLEALLQRFGRVNRGRSHAMICPVYVCQMPDDEVKILPYEVQDVQDALAILHQHNGEIIQEEQLGAWLDALYDDERTQRWQVQFDMGYQQTQHLLQQIKPYTDSSPQITQQFYRLFDGRDVLPVACIDEYEDALEQRDFIGARQYAVSISWKNYHQLKSYGVIIDDPDNELPHVDMPYTSDVGLMLDWEQLG